MGIKQKYDENPFLLGVLTGYLLIINAGDKRRNYV
jgi:hypothetical protein